MIMCLSVLLPYCTHVHVYMCLCVLLPYCIRLCLCVCLFCSKDNQPGPSGGGYLNIYMHFWDYCCCYHIPGKSSSGEHCASSSSGAETPDPLDPFLSMMEGKRLQSESDGERLTYTCTSLHMWGCFHRHAGGS